MVQTNFDIRENVPLASLTTIGIGGPARFFATATEPFHVAEAVRWASEARLPMFVLGGGSNLLISDKGFQGLVLHVRLLGITIDEERDSTLVRAAAGEEWDPLVAFCTERGLAGVETLSGIPGSVGATPIQNVGAYGQEVKETIENVELFDRQTASFLVMSNSECRFDYRQSRFKRDEPGRFVIVAVTYRLKRGEKPSIRYPELRRYFDERGIADPSLMETRTGVLEIRRRKGMVIDPTDPDTKSDGSFFMNPVVSSEEHTMLLARLRQIEIETSPAAFPSGDGKVKLSAAWLIENAGFQKGFQLGRAGLSSKHSLAIVNRGQATATEVVDLVHTIQETVREKFGVALHPEPNFIGFE